MNERKSMKAFVWQQTKYRVGNATPPPGNNAEINVLIPNSLISAWTETHKRMKMRTKREKQADEVLPISPGK